VQISEANPGKLVQGILGYGEEADPAWVMCFLLALPIIIELTCSGS